MRFFVWLDFQYEMIALFLGAISLIMVYARLGGLPEKTHSQNRTGTRGKRVHERESGHHTEKNPIGPFLIYTYLLIAAWAFSYLIFVWANGSRF